jgi:hypothetical protein
MVSNVTPTKARFGKPVPLLVDAKGFPNGRLVEFEIWKQSGQNKEKIAEVNGVVKQEKAVGYWEPSFKREPRLPLKDKITSLPQTDQYTFKAFIDKGTADELTTQGTPIEFTYPLEIYVEDVNGKPLNGVKFTVTLSDGSKKTDIFRNGHVKIEDAPVGKFTVELEDYDFVFE